MLEGVTGSDPARYASRGSSRIFHRRCISVLLLIAASLFLIGCSTGQPVSDAGPEAEPADSHEALDPDAAVDVEEALGFRAGSAFVYPVPACGAPDPAIDPVMADGPMSSEIHAGLTSIGEDGGNYITEFELAESFSMSADRTVYRFTLRKGLKFSDGSPISAIDFKWSWERAVQLARPGSKANTAFSPRLSDLRK